MSPRARVIGALLATAAALGLGVLAAWPIYRTPSLLVVAVAALVLGAGASLVRERWRLGFPVFAAILLGVFALSVVPVAVPDALRSASLGGLGAGLVDGLAAVALGWKQLLTLDLPVGTYQTVLVPAYVVWFATAVLVVFLALRGRSSRRAALIPTLAAIPMLAPVAFGTVFGASAVSAPLHLGPLTIAAPREVSIWIAAAALAAVWVAWTAGAERRAALKLGRAGDPRARRGGAARGLLGAAIVAVALIAGVALAPLLDAEARDVPRDHAQPEIVVRDTPSPLAAYRTAKRDSGFDAPLFSVASSGEMPERLQLAVLDAYDGIDFHVSADEASLFKRFPAGVRAERPAEIEVQVKDGYADIWVPIAGLASPPRFTGPRAAALADAFYLNRGTETGIAVPRGDEVEPGLIAGDGFTAQMETAAAGDATGDAAQSLGEPRSNASQIDLEQAPQLASWLETQQTTDFATLLDRLRARGYLSHSLTDGEGERMWLERLSEQHGTTFETSAGGHSLTRIEALFEQLNTQQSAAGEDATEQQLIAAIGDDEQFAAAAALVARALGYDSRVVLGVRLAGGAGGGIAGDADQVPGVPACENECTGEHLAAWVEVRGDNGEWVAFDVTPQVDQAPKRIEEGEQLPEFSTTPEERDAREVDPPLGLGEQSDGESEENDALADAWLWPILRAVGLVTAAILLLLLPLLFLPVAKRLRARRRSRQAVPELRALSAWEEMVDRARDAGVQVPERASRLEIAEAIGSAPAVWAAEQVDRAVFSERGIEPGDADMLWLAVQADSDERRQTQTRRQRLRAAYSLRSYVLRAGGRRVKPSDSNASAEFAGAEKSEAQ